MTPTESPLALTGLTLREMVGRRFRTQSEFAEAAGIHEMIVSRNLNGQDRPSHKNGLRYMEILGISRDQLDAAYDLGVVAARQSAGEAAK